MKHLLAKAIKLAAGVHDEQVDKSGEPYILHPLAIMNTVERGGRFMEHRLDERLLIVAVLHDVLEDVKVKKNVEERRELRDCIRMTFGEEVLEALDCLTKQEGEHYTTYIERAASNWISRRVKIADLTHNMDPSRLPSGTITDIDFERWDKYRKALVRLKRED